MRVSEEVIHPEQFANVTVGELKQILSTIPDHKHVLIPQRLSDKLDGYTMLKIVQDGVYEFVYLEG